MTEIRRNSTEILVVGPFVTSAGVAVTSMVLASASAAYAMLHDTSNAVDISGYTVATATCPGYFYLTLASAITSVVGPAVISVQNPTVHLPVEKNYRVLGSAPFDSIYSSAPTLLSSLDVGLLYESVISSASSAVYEMADGFSHNDVWNDLVCTVTDDSGGVTVGRYVVDCVQATNKITISSATPFTVENGVDVLRVFASDNAAGALTNYDPPTRTELASDRDTILAEVSAIRAKTDIFVFDASTSANLNVNVKMFGGVTIVGSGSSDSLFRTAGT